MQSNLNGKGQPHVAIIMDGNGRWASARGLPRPQGHRAGVEAARRVVEAAPRIGVSTLTLFAFASDNWQRPKAEVASLLALLDRYLQGELRQLVRSGIRLTVIGRRSRLPDGLKEAIIAAEAASAGGNRLDLRIAIDYSARDAIADAAMRWRFAHAPSRAAFGRLLVPPRLSVPTDVDLLIRSGGEKRLSDFLLWELAYAELHFVDTLWPDFGPEDLRRAMAEFYRRERRFGRLPPDRRFCGGAKPDSNPNPAHAVDGL
jgi:undecaprenyl diphosphate synthase